MKERERELCMKKSLGPDVEVVYITSTHIPLARAHSYGHSYLQGRVEILFYLCVQKEEMIGDHLALSAPTTVVDCFFIGLLATYIFSSIKCASVIFAYFSTELFVLLKMIFRSSLYYTSFVMLFENLFSQSVTSHFTTSELSFFFYEYRFLGFFFI